MEGEINTVGYSRLNERNAEAAINLFKLNTILFPGSGNTFDSLGECCLILGLKEEGIENYRKALLVEPNYPNAEEAKKIINAQR